MKRFLTLIFTVMTFSVFSTQAWANLATDTSDLWDINQGNVVTGMYTAGVFPGSDARNMFGGEFGTVDDPGNTVFYDAQIFGPGSIAWVSWQTPTPVKLDRFVLSVVADGNYPVSYNRAIQGFNLYAGDDGSVWNPVYASGPLPTPLGTYDNGLYYYTIDYTFSSPITGQHFKADFIYGSYVTGPRIKELDGYGIPVPLPGSMVLLGLGLIGLAGLRRKEISFHRSSVRKV
ncbi:MAG: PEP-CTERM sorting domain-containing protein [Desulfobacula sp.]|jgi:hypothetical protein